jgi:hypothetical protein
LIAQFESYLLPLAHLDGLDFAMVDVAGGKFHFLENEAGQIIGARIQANGRSWKFRRSVVSPRRRAGSGRARRHGRLATLMA